MIPLAFYKQCFHLTKATFVPIDPVDAMVSLVYKVIAPTPFILKICPRPGDYWREVYFLKFFSSLLPVPQILQAQPPSPTHEGALLLECLPGKPAKNISPKLMYDVGALLAVIHLNRFEGYGDLTQNKPLDCHARPFFQHKFEESFLECRDHVSSSLLKKCYNYYETYVDALKAVDGPCLTHRDFRPSNVMVYKDKVTGIIDWARGRAGFAEEDFSPLQLGEWSHDVNLKQAFLKGYASVRPVPDDTVTMPLLLMSRALSVLGLIFKKETHTTFHKHAYRANLSYLESFFKQ